MKTLLLISSALADESNAGNPAVEEVIDAVETATSTANAVLTGFPVIMIRVLEAEDRAYREAVGRALCVIAQEAERVTRCICGIGVIIK